jgi:amicyanin
MNRKHALHAVLTVGASTAVLLLAGCATDAEDAAPDAKPAAIAFDPSISVTPGMAPEMEPGMSMPMLTSAPTLPSGAAASGGTPIDISNFAMEPAQVTVTAGTTVTWTNHDDEPHTVVAEDGTFRSPALDTGATYSFTFAAPGTYDYTCSIHPFMTATVVVTK